MFGMYLYVFKNAKSHDVLTDLLFLATLPIVIAKATGAERFNWFHRLCVVSRNFDVFEQQFKIQQCSTEETLWIIDVVAIREGIHTTKSDVIILLHTTVLWPTLLCNIKNIILAYGYGQHCEVTWTKQVRKKLVLPRG